MIDFTWFFLQIQSRHLWDSVYAKWPDDWAWVQTSAELASQKYTQGSFKILCNNHYPIQSNPLWYSFRVFVNFFHRLCVSNSWVATGASVLRLGRGCCCYKTELCKEYTQSPNSAKSWRQQSADTHFSFFSKWYATGLLVCNMCIISIQSFYDKGQKQNKLTLTMYCHWVLTGTTELSYHLRKMNKYNPETDICKLRQEIFLLFFCVFWACGFIDPAGGVLFLKIFTESNATVWQ